MDVKLFKYIYCISTKRRIIFRQTRQINDSETKSPTSSKPCDVSGSETLSQYQNHWYWAFTLTTSSEICGFLFRVEKHPAERSRTYDSVDGVVRAVLTGGGIRPAATRRFSSTRKLKVAHAFG